MQLRFGIHAQRLLSLSSLGLEYDYAQPFVVVCQIFNAILFSVILTYLTYKEIMSLLLYLDLFIIITCPCMATVL